MSDVKIEEKAEAIVTTAEPKAKKERKPKEPVEKKVVVIYSHKKLEGDAFPAPVLTVGNRTHSLEHGVLKTTTTTTASPSGAVKSSSRTEIVAYTPGKLAADALAEALNGSDPLSTRNLLRAKAVAETPVPSVN